MEAEERIEKIAQFAKEKQSEAMKQNQKLADALTYRWEHTLRVSHNGKILAEKEGANMEVVIAACLLHDIAKLSHQSHDVEHGRVGARMVRPFLQELGYTTVDVENICFSVANHVDGKADFEHPLTLEAKIVSDADKIDRVSAYKTIFPLRKFVEQEFEVLAHHAEIRLSYIQKFHQQKPVQTESGKKIFDAQISIQIAYLKRLVSDYKITNLPELD